jgi:uncharacterized repeat protein (TIGR03803 family)
MRNRGFAMACIVLAFCAATAIAAHAQTFGVTQSFNDEDGAFPIAPLTQYTDGFLYGTTSQGGADLGNCGNSRACGTVFGLPFEVLHTFCLADLCPDGQFPSGGLVLAPNGNFYGTTQGGFTYGSNCGGYGCGTVFELSLSDGSVLTTLYSFLYTNALGPYAGLTLAANGNLYGTTQQGGTYSEGTVFEITLAGKLTTLYNFCAKANCIDGKGPGGTLIQAANGNLYGTAGGGANCNGGCGIIFEITPAGKLTTLYSFCAQTNCADGVAPVGLVQATNGNFYGTTEGGGANCVSDGGCGTVFEITPAGKLTTLYSFCSMTSCADGSYPQAGLIQATDGNFYGTTSDNGAGTVFKVTPAGKLTTLYTFCSQQFCTDGEGPRAVLLQDTSGALDGTTYYGGNYGFGTTFSLSVGLGPFVKTVPTSGKVGAAVIILGNNLTGTTKVSIKGTAATFTVVSSTEITTTVPTGATTGTVEVTTPTGTLKSNVVFRIP